MDIKKLGDSPCASSSSRLAPTGKNVMVGFDDDLIAIKARLCGESSKLQVIPIFGMGGIGKTTLARNAYDDPLMMHYFYIRAWVTVSQDYSTQEILSSLLVSLKEFNAERSGQSKMAEKVYRSLKGRRYLIVMDDMWSTRAWDDVKMIFPDDHNGSRIMLTTRLSDVAAYAASSSPLHEMRFMNADQSWDLLRQKMLIHEDCPPGLENIGKETARSCRGLPLAIVMIAGLLSTVSRTPASWDKIAKNINSVVATEDGEFEKILSLSYTHLPHHLKPCFLYMGAFPEDYKICVSKLIKLWVAEGFFKPNGSKTFEEGAEEYLEDLVKRSLVYEFLLIYESHLELWITESSHFPSLQCLLLHRCPCLSEIPDGIGEIPTLQLIEVKYGNKSLADSAKRIQEEQQSWGNDALQVRCVHSEQSF